MADNNNGWFKRFYRGMMTAFARVGSRRPIRRQESARRRRLEIDLLEDRTLLSGGVTIITHGYQLGGSNPDDPGDWVRKMETAIEYRAAPAPVIFLDYYYETGNLQFAATGNAVPTNFSPDQSTEYILATFWGAKSERPTPGWAEAVGEGLYGVLRRYDLADGVRPLHFIGHSFGTVVNSEAIQRLGYFDHITVNQMTTLDPHDWDEAGVPIDGDALVPDVQVWDNVHFADNYYETDGGPGVLIPHGREIGGAVNIDLTDRPGFNSFFSNPHSLVHDWYQYTIDTTSPNPDPNWYPEGRGNVGFRYSLIGRGQPSQPASPTVPYAGPLPLRNPPPDYLNGRANTNGANDDVGGGEGDRWNGPPRRIFNGDFFTTAPAIPRFGQAGYGDGLGDNPLIADFPGRAKDYAARLNGNAFYSDPVFTHRPVYFPTNVSAFSFDYYVTVSDADDSLYISFLPDHEVQPYTFPASAILRNATILNPGYPIPHLQIDASNFSDLANHLAGKLVNIQFELIEGGTHSSPVADLLIDNLDLQVGSNAAQAKIIVTSQDGSRIVNNATIPIHLRSVAQGQAGPTYTFHVGNEGQAALAIQNLVLAPSNGFNVIDGLPATLNPLAWDDLTIKLTSANVGVFTSTVKIFSNDPNAGTFQFAIDGTVTAPATKPDLALETVDGPLAGVIGSTISVRTVAHNIGTVGSGSYSVRYFLSIDPNIAADDLSLTAQPVGKPGLGADQSADWQQTLTLPSNLAAGRYWLGAILTPDDPTNEKDDTNQVQVDTSAITVNAPLSSAPGFQYPTGSALEGTTPTQHFGDGTDADHLGHLGTDFRGSQGDAVNAVADGIVTRVYDAGTGWDQVVIVKHFTTAWGWDKDVFSMYAHVTPQISVGTQVKRGQLIALIGPTAAGSTGPHLHFEIRSGADAGSRAGPGYLGRLFDRTQETSVIMPGYSYDITWYDPEKTLSQNLYAAGSVRIDLDPKSVSGPSTANTGSTIAVQVNVENLWPSASGSYDLAIVLSTNTNITLQDRQLATVTKPSIPGRGSQVSTILVNIPSDVAPGSYYLGVIADPNNAITEVNEDNNAQAADAVIVIRTAPSTKPDLVGTHLELRPKLQSYTWGQSVGLAFDVKNVGNVASGNTSVQFSLVNDPQNPTFETVLGTRAFGPLQSQNTGGTTISLNLPSSPPTGLPAGPLFLRMVVDPANTVNEDNEANNSGQGSGIDWVRLPMASAGGLPDLIGESLVIRPLRNSYYWGDPIRLEYTFKNQGSAPANFFNYEFYLSSTPTFDRADHLLRPRSYGILNPGVDDVDSVYLYLPSAPPAGYSDGPLYIGVGLDPEHRLSEMSDSNNSGVGLGIDYVRVFIVGSPPPDQPPEPVIGTFKVSPNVPIVRGEKLYLTASNVTDDQVVNQVVFRLDTNNNGKFDASDLYVADGSKDGTTFTATVNTNASWPNGTSTILAQAMDNNGLVSAVASASVTIIGVPPGPFADDAYENNDTQETAAFLGGATSYNISNLAFAQGDPDYYMFQVLGGAGQIQVSIDFAQDNLPLGTPKGDLTLELRRVGSGSSLGFSDTSTAGNTHEQVSISAGSGSSLPEGQYVVIVGGAAGYEQNPNYTLHISVSPVSGAATPGPLVLSKTTLVQGEPITLSMTGITGIPASQIDGVHFYGDFNHNGQIEFDQEYLGSDWGPNGDGASGEFTINASSLNWPLGTTYLLSLVSKVNGPSSLAQIVPITVLPDKAPTIASLTAPSTAIQGGTAVLTANNVGDADPGGTVTRVAFTLDTNMNGVLDGDDFPLGNGTASGSNWSITAPTSAWPLGIVRVFATPTDNLGLVGAPVSATLTVQASDNQQPVIGTFALPDFVNKGDALPLLAGNVTDPNGDTLVVKFYADSDGDGALGPADLLLGTGTQNGADWSLNASTSSFIQGVQRLFAQVSDNGVPSFSQVVSATVTIIDTAGPRVIAQSPSAPVLGSLDSVRVTFDEPINVSTFTTADITSFSGPGGSITPTSVDVVSGSGNTQFDIHFSRQTGIGAYSLQVGPNVLDVADNPMNQDGDAVNGESGADAYALSFTIQSPLADFNWAEAFGGASGTEIAYALATDSSGNLYVTGMFRDTVDFDPGSGTANRTSAAGTDIFVAKYSSAGAFVWATAMGGASNSEVGQGIGVDASGNVYVTGYFANAANFGSFQLTSLGSNNAFLVKLNSSGTVQWAQRMGGTLNTIGTNLVVDGSGIYTTGSFTGTASFGGISRTSAGDRDIFITKWNSAGSVQWANIYGGAGYDYGYGITVDASSNVYASGIFNGTVTFGSDTLDSSTGFGYALKLTSAGDFVWARGTGGFGLAAAAAPSGDVYFAGAFSGTIDADPGSANLPMSSFGSNDVFISKLAPDGSLRWAKQLGGGGYDQANGVAVDSSGNVYTVGQFASAADFDPNGGVYTLTSAGADDAFVSKLDSAGNYVWARSLGSTDYDRGFGVAVDVSRVDVAGFFSATAHADAGGSASVTLNPIGNWDVFMAQLAPPPVNDPPVVGSISDKSVGEGSQLTFTATATDPNSGQTIAFSLDGGAPAGAGINANSGVFSWTPTEAQGPGTYTITVRATDNGSPVASGTRTFHVTVSEVNQAPTLASIANQFVFEGADLHFTATATDADLPANTLTFSLALGAPSGASIDPVTGVFSWRPTEVQGPNVFTVTVKVTDNGSPNLSASKNVSITVRESNQAPVLQAIGNQTVYAGNTLSFTAHASDADLPANNLAFSLAAGAPLGAQINPTTGVFTWTPPTTQNPGDYPVTVRVTDNGSPVLRATETISIHVIAYSPPPKVVSINLTTPTGPMTNATTVAYTVAFSTNVTGVDASDFNLALSGVTATAPVEVAGSGATYTVTINGITGNGTLGLNLVDDGTIRDAANKRLFGLNAAFASQATFAAGTNPQSVVTADANGDDKQDVIVANQATKSVSVLLGNGVGSFPGRQTISTGTFLTSVSAADVNGDGKVDLLVANGFGANSVGVMLGNGDGSFQSQVTFPVGAFPYFVAVADVNNDGTLDLIAVNLGSNNLSVLLGNGNGTFQTQQTFATGANPNSVATADVNGDGRLDLVAVNGSSDTVSVLLGNGDGSFLNQQTFATGANPLSVVVKDINGDGKPDVIVANSISNSGNSISNCVSVLVGNGDGSFQPQQTFATGTFPNFVAAWDVNGDGKQDLVVTNQNANSVSVLLGNGNGSFQTHVTFAAGSSPVSVATADVNGDDRPDLVIANYNNNTVSVLLNLANGNFSGQAYTIDQTPPSAGAVRDGVGADIAFQASTTTISANWTGFSDSGSGIASYQWAIGTSPGGADIQAFTNVGSSTSASASGLGLSNGSKYYVSVKATDNVGNISNMANSNGVTVDTTPPSTGAVNDGSGADIAFQASTTAISANWTGFSDSGSGIASYQWAIGTSSGGTDVQAFINVGSATSANASGLSLSDGTKYYVSVRAFDNVGTMGSTASSNGVTVDATPPNTGAVNDGSAADINFQASTTTVSSNWSGFSDGDSGIASYQWAIGTSPGGTDVQAFVGVGNATSATRNSLSLSNGATYYVSVRAIDNVGNVSSAVSSNGVTLDTSPPSVGTVNDGSGADISFQISTTTIFANWTGFSDGGSSIESYQWAIGTSAGGANVQAFTDVGNVASASNSSLALSNGTKYYVSVRAIDNVGNVSNAASSNGVTVDTSPPNTGTVNDGLGADISFQGSATTIFANWTDFSDSGSGVASYQWAIGTSTGGTDVQAFTSVGIAISANVAGLSLSDGTTYYVSVRAIDNVGNVSSAASSNGVFVDTTPPNTGVVTDGAAADIAFQASTTTVFANWSGFSDAGSGLASYQWAIGTAPGGTDLQAFTNVGSATSANAADLSLTSGTKYFVSVKVMDKVGNVSSAAASNGVTVVTVNDGPGADISIQASTTAIAVNWSGFNDIVSYQWAIGTSPGGVDVQVYTDVGSATSASALGLSLTEGVTYFASVKATDNGGLVCNVVSSNGVTVDITSPVSAVQSLPTFSPGSLSLNWSGSDSGSGVASYSIYASDDGAAFQPLLINTTTTSVIFNGQDGHTYGFFSIATDNVGNVEAAPTDAQASTRVDAIAPTSSVAALPAFSTGNITITWSGSDDPPASGVAAYDIYISDNSGAFTLFQQGTQQTSAVFVSQAGHRYGFYSVATDNAGNRENKTPAIEAETRTPVFQRSLAAIAEDATAPAGIRVSDLLNLHFTDVNANAKSGIAVAQMDGNGKWQYSADGALWMNFGAVSMSQARLLSSSYRLRFVPAKNSSAPARLFFEGWDGGGAAAGTTLAITGTGGANPFSIDTGLVTEQVNPVNDAPTWTTVAAAVAFSNDLAVIAAGKTIAEVAGAAFSDVDGNTPVGVAVIALTRTADGAWQYSRDQGSTWIDFGAVSLSTARLLTATDKVRFIPSIGFTGKATIKARAWDGTTGVAGSTANLSGTGKTGGATAFSANVLTVADFVNAAPTLGSATGPAQTINEDKTSAPVAVTSLLAVAQAADADAGALRGIAIVGVTGPGTWQYTLDGTTWRAFGTVSETSGRLLASTAKVRFVPKANQNGQATLTYRSWDRTAGASGTLFAINSTDGVTPFSAAEATSIFTITPVNDAPTWTSTAATILLLDDANVLAAGKSVAEVAGNLFRDVDGNASVGVAVVALTGTANGAWQYSRDDGQNWNNFGTVSASAARLLIGSDKIRFVANANFSGKETIQVRAWDGATGTAGGTANVSSANARGGATAFSANVLTVTTFTNAAPTLSSTTGPALTTIEDHTSAAVAVTTLLASAQAADSPGALKGVAIVAATGPGTWQYTLEGITFLALGSVSEASARLLASSAKVRFLPAANQNGQVTLTYRAWDQSMGANGKLFAITNTGGAAPFSAAEAISTLTITPVNDAPVVNTAVKPIMTPILPGTTNSPGDAVGNLLAGVVTDVDPSALRGLAIVALTGTTTGHWEASVDNGTNWQAIGTVSTTSALLLRDTDRIRYVPNAGFIGKATFSFKAWDRTSGNFGTKATTMIGTAFSQAVDVATVLVNNAPTLS